MNGPWHYSEAERLIEQVASTPADDSTRDVLAVAQVHATLALAAAAAAEQATEYDGDETHQRSRGWAGVI